MTFRSRRLGLAVARVRDVTRERARRKQLGSNRHPKLGALSTIWDFYARYRVSGKLVWKSRKTTAFSVAKRRLPDTIRDHRSKRESLTSFANDRMTVADAAEVYLAKVRANVSLKPRSKDYRVMMIDFIRRSWPLLESDVRKVGERDIENWRVRYQQHYAPTVVNKKHWHIARRVAHPPCGSPPRNARIPRETVIPAASPAPLRAKVRLRDY